jgi:hydroxymethylpyrimidine pyrophosphatase-like HAD family hydrolase
MRYFALACDYDGTLARDGVVSKNTLEALKQVRKSGRKLILVTGRELPDLQRAMPDIELFDSVVAENGALLFHPSIGEQALGERPPERFINALSERGVKPLSVGHVIVSTWEPHETTVLETIRDLGLELQVIFNKGAVMILPTGINKASGLTAALEQLKLSPRNTVGVGDAENDHAFLSLSECGVAVANALPMLKERADLVTKKDHGDGVIELIDSLRDTDLRELRIARHDIPLGTTEDGRKLHLRPYVQNVLIAGTSQGGKTSLTTGIIDRIVEKGYQVCVVDPEGDYSALDRSVMLGGEHTATTADEVTELLFKPDENVVVNLLGISLDDRPLFFTNLMTRLLHLRASAGRPHWIVIDEAHHLWPASFDPTEIALPRETYGLIMITVEPDKLAPAVLSMVHTIIAVGDSPEQTIQSFCNAVGEGSPPLKPTMLEKGEAVIWSRGVKSGPVRFQSIPATSESRRHRRKYAEGELPPERSFYFQGPDKKLNLRAQNLSLFLQLGDGVDDETWLYHLRQGDFSRWFREEINDEELAEEAEQIERQRTSDIKDSRAAIRDAVEKRYTAPA